MSAGPESHPVRRQVIYHGRVQGVFFRATAFELSGDFRIVGHVRNLYDGTVELEAQGAPSEVDGFLAAVANHFKHNITKADVTGLPADGEESEFRIRY